MTRKKWKLFFPLSQNLSQTNKNNLISWDNPCWLRVTCIFNEYNHMNSIDSWTINLCFCRWFKPKLNIIYPSFLASALSSSPPKQNSLQLILNDINILSVFNYKVIENMDCNLYNSYENRDRKKRENPKFDWHKILF